MLLVRSSICDIASDSDVSDSMYRSMALTSHAFMGIAWACMGIPMMMSSSKYVALTMLDDDLLSEESGEDIYLNDIVDTDQF